MLRERISALVDQYGAENLLAVLHSHFTERRQQLVKEQAKKRLSSVQVAMEAPCDLHNVLAASRSCEAFGLRTLHVVAPEGKRPRNRKTARGAHRWIEVRRHVDLTKFMHRTDPLPWRYAASSASAELTVEELPVDQPLCLLFGNEERGLSETALSQCHFTYRIPMSGMAESLNLSVSVALSAYEVAKRRRLYLNASGDLTATEQQQEVPWGYVRTLGLDKAAIILKAGLQVPKIELQ